jgi:predicted permease
MQINLVTKLKPGVSVSSAEQQLKALIVDSSQSMLRGGELHLNLISASRGIADSRAPLSRPLWLALALAGVLLLVACANTGGLLVARFASRQREFGVRIAIGAGRARLVRQLTAEALTIAALAALVALAVAWVAAPVLLRSVPIGTVPPAFDLRLDWRLWGFTAAISAIAALLAAAASSVRLLRTDPSRLLAAGNRTVVPGRRALTNTLIAAQVACSLVLLTTAGAMARTLINLAHVDPGFDPHETFAVRVDASHRAVGGPGAHEYYARLEEQIAALPHVERVSLVQLGLMTGAATSGTADILGFVPLADEDRWVRMFFVGSEFFDTTGMTMVAGESLQAMHMQAHERVAVVNEQFARFYFGTPDRAIGKTVNRDVRILGVVADARYDNLREPAVRAMFVPFTQAPPRRQMTFEVRPAESVASSLAVDAVTSVIRRFDSQLNFTVTSGTNRLASTMARERFTASLAAVLSLLAVFLSCMGLYAAVAYAVSERRHEFAVRLALGATGRDIIGEVIRDPLRTTAIGIAIGLPCVYLLMQALSSLLFHVGSFDVPTVCGAAVLLLGVGTLAGIPAAFRVASIDPQESLQWE